MERKLQKNELALWKEVTKTDTKINDYISEEMIEVTENTIEKKTKILKKSSNVKNERVSLNLKEEYLNINKPQINKRMKSKFERGLIRPEAVLDLHGFNRVEAEKKLSSFINTCINKEKRCILIVTGKRKTILGSKSILRELVPKWLDKKEYTSLVLAHSFATQKDGGDGARYILLRKKGLINEKNC